MSAHCTICAHPQRAEIDSRLLSGQSGHRISQELGLSIASLYRHSRSRHHKEGLRVAQEATALAVGSTNGHSLDPKLTAQLSKSLRQAESLMRLAWKHLKATAVGSDPKATNGAISAANKTLELISEMRGDLNPRGKGDVTLIANAQAAMDVHAAAQELGSHETIDAAQSFLAAQLEAGDAHAQRVVMELVRMLPGADASTEPQALTGALAPSAPEIIPERSE